MAPKSWVLLFLHLCRVSSLVINPPQAIENGALNSLLPQASSSALANITSLDAGDPECNANVYGKPGLSSCRQALSRMPDSSGEGLALFGTRPPSPVAQYGVPSRVISREFLP